MSENSATIRLSEPDRTGAVPLETCLGRRRSVRRYQGGGIGLSEIAQLLWACQGVTDPPDLRTAPSGGALYPLEIHLVAGDVAGLEPGTYRYSPHRHALARTGQGDIRASLCAAALDQDCVATAPVSFVCSAIYRRSTVKYGERGMRYAMIESGNVSQNLYLQATALELGTVIVGAFDDEAVKEMLGLDAACAPLWIMPLGKGG